jgi:hypothetical protein
VCPDTPDRDQADLDGDRVGDLCDPDADGDGVRDAPDAAVPGDNCLQLANPDQADADRDGVGDACAASAASGLAGGRPGAVPSRGGPAALAAQPRSGPGQALAFAGGFAAAGLVALGVAAALLRPGRKGGGSQLP